jgi:hypothetical protein
MVSFSFGLITAFGLFGFSIYANQNLKPALKSSPLKTRHKCDCYPFTLELEPPPSLLAPLNANLKCNFSGNHWAVWLHFFCYGISCSWAIFQGPFGPYLQRFLCQQFPALQPCCLQLVLRITLDCRLSFLIQRSTIFLLIYSLRLLSVVRISINL